MSILIKNASFVLTQNSKKEILKDTDILLENDKIVEIGKKIRQPAEFVVDCKNKLVMPGLINSHTHAPMTLFRGIADDLPLMEWLKNYIWPMEQKLTAKDVYDGALLGCLEMIKTGTTCFGDMYFFADEIGKAIESSGIRGLVSSVVVDLLPENIASFKVLEDTLKKIRGLRCNRIIPWLGPHAVYSCSTETLQKVKEKSRKENLRINIHLSETASEVKETKQKFGKSPVEYLDSIKFLDSTVTAAHCVHLTENEIKILKDRDVKIVHCPVSNMKTVAGISPIPEILHRGCCISLGTDGAASNNCLDLFREMKAAALIHKINKQDPTAIPSEKVLEFVTVNGAVALGLEDQIGSIEVGKKADVIIVNLKKPNLTPILSSHSILSHLVYSITGNDVETVIADGKILMENRKVMTMDEDNVIEKAQKAAEEIQAKLS